jgi:outer membrane protein OmpA-like peptidoglycan-associated protein
LKQSIYIFLLLLLCLFCFSCRVNKGCKTCGQHHQRSEQSYNRSNAKLAGQNFRQNKNPHGGVIVYFPDNKKDFFNKADTTDAGDDAIPKFTTTSPDKNKKGKFVSDTVLLYFSRNYENQLSPESFSKLYYLKEFLVKNKEVKIEIEVHCFPADPASFKKLGYYSVDSSTVKNSIKFSEYRAMCIKNYLKENKIDENRITISAMGCTDPFYEKPHNLNELMENERVYVIISKKVR